MMEIKFELRARKEYEFFKKHDKNILCKIIELLENIKLHPYSGLGKPEPLKHQLSEYWSRRITKEHRLVYKIEGDVIIIIASCRSHY